MQSKGVVRLGSIRPEELCGQLIGKEASFRIVDTLQLLASRIDA